MVLQIRDLVPGRFGAIEHTTRLDLQADETDAIESLRTQTLQSLIVRVPVRGESDPGELRLVLVLCHNRCDLHAFHRIGKCL